MLLETRKGLIGYSRIIDLILCTRKHLPKLEGKVLKPGMDENELGVDLAKMMQKKLLIVVYFWKGFTITFPES